MATVSQLYGTAAQAITITLASLASGSARASTAVDNTTNLFLDALVSVKLKTGAAGVSATGHVDVYVYGTVDGGTSYTDAATGTDAAFTLLAYPNLRSLGPVNAIAVATTYIGGPFSIANAFGGSLPAKWGLVLVNNTGAALDATAGSFVVQYQGLQATVA